MFVYNLQTQTKVRIFANTTSSKLVSTANIQKAMVKTIKKKRIVVRPNLVKALAAEFEAPRTSVYLSLNFTSNSERARRIREAALSRYNGVEIEETKVV